jgi:hypothetical protein
MGLGKPIGTRGLLGTGPGLASQQSAGRALRWVWNRPDPFLRSKPGLQAGYPDPLLTLLLPHLQNELQQSVNNCCPSIMVNHSAMWRLLSIYIILTVIIL